MLQKSFRGHSYESTEISIEQANVLRMSKYTAIVFTRGNELIITITIHIIAS